MADKISFIYGYFIKIHERNRHILDNDPNMTKKLKAKFDE